MKFIKKTINRTNKLIYQARINKLDKNKRRNIRINKFVSLVTIILYFTLFLIIIAIANKLSSTYQQWYWTVLIVIGTIISLVFIPLSISILFYAILSRFFPTTQIPVLKLEELAKCTKPLRDYYRLSDTYLVTKCYHSTDEKFINKDVILFFVDRKLRIMNNLFRSTKDLGCYEFNLSEVKIYNQTNDNKTKTVIQATDFTFLLGYRAKTFIKKTRPFFDLAF